MVNRIKRAQTIVFLTHEFTQSGAPFCLLDIVRQMTAQGRTCILLGPPRGILRDEFVAAGARLIPIPEIPWLYVGAKKGKLKLLYLPVRLLVNCLIQLTLLFRLKKLRPDIIHLNSFATRFAAIAARLSGSRTVWYLLEYHTFKPLLRNAARMLVRLSSDRVVAISRATLDWWSGGRSGAKYSVLYNGFRLSSLPPIPFAERTFDVVFIGRFSREKGAGDLVQAAALLAGHGVRLRIAMVGAFDSQHDEGWLRGLLRLHQVDDLFIWHTHHPHPTEIIRQSRVLALPSYREGFGRVLLEAMACRVPVVATPVGGVPEVVRANETGVIVPVGDIEALAGGLNSLTQNRTLNEKMGEAGFASVRDHFSENRFAERLAELYDGVLI